MLPALVCILCAMLALPSASVAQAGAPSPRMLAVDGLQTRVWTASIEGRKPGQPVMVLEAGAGADLETWKPIFSDLMRVGPVIAYDRRALGQSEADTAPPTFTRTAETLHAVLQALKVPPPYVLVGHSMGGVFIRGFASMYPNETVGMVYLDVPDFESTREERAAVLPRRRSQGRARAACPAGNSSRNAAWPCRRLSTATERDARRFPVGAQLETAAGHSGCGRDYDAGGSHARQWRGDGSPADEAPVRVDARIAEQSLCSGRAHRTSSPPG